MAKLSLRRYDVQAKVSIAMAVVAFLGLCAMGFLIMRRYNPEMKMFIYGSKTLYAPAIYAAAAVTMLLSITAAAMGGNSAGQRRNELTRLSWAGFFAGIAVLSITIILFVWFNLNKFPQAPKG